VSTGHTIADDVVYDLISVQYHALNGAQLYEKFISDAEGHSDVQDFFRQVQQQDNERAQRCHDLLRELTHGGGLSA
jgi:hypothetical protein